VQYMVSVAGKQTLTILNNNDHNPTRPFAEECRTCRTSQHALKQSIIRLHQPSHAVVDRIALL
jgi:hypothetical protein